MTELTLDDAELASSSTVLRLYHQVFGVLAAQSGAMIPDPSSLDIDDAILTAFAEGESDSLTLEQVRGACHAYPGTAVERRFELLVAYGAISKVVDRPGERRYRASFAPYVMLAFLRRMAERGGQTELHRLLTLEGIGLQARAATADDGRAALRRLTHVFRLLANELTSLTMRGAVERLRESAQLLWGNRELVTRAEEVHGVVLDRWPELDRPCGRFRMALAAYGDAVESAAGRLVERAGTTRALGLLPVETWVTFARTSDAATLAGALDDLLFDAPAPWFDPQEMAEAVATGRVVVDARTPPPRPGVHDAAPVVEPPPDDSERLRALCEEALAGRDAATVVDILEAAGGWTAARRVLSDLAAGHHDPSLPYELVWGDGLRIDPGSTPSWVAEGTFRRVQDDAGRDDARPGPNRLGEAAG